ncbi:MAG: hypothetical protein QOD02_912 [Mycobacterium sp.]|nr:hypothetical protein [Mycobacterium sp.]
MLAAAIVAIVGVLSNAGAGHPLTDFSVFGYHLTGSTGTLFLFGIAVGAVASLGLGRWVSGEYSTTGRVEVSPQSRHVVAKGSGDARSADWIPLKLYRSKGPISLPTPPF